MRSVLVDAGPLVALLSSRDNRHRECVDVLKSLDVPLLTSWTVVTEAMYLLGFSLRAQTALLTMIEREAVVVESPTLDILPTIRRLMQRYADLPMDFADATLVALANERRLDRVFTLDARDFSVYRLDRGKSFVVVP